MGMESGQDVTHSFLLSNNRYKILNLLKHITHDFTIKYPAL